jgi:hypothetical protein
VPLSFFEAAPGRDTQSKNFFLPVSHFLQQNETTAGWQDPKIKFSLKINSPYSTVPVCSIHCYCSTFALGLLKFIKVLRLKFSFSSGGLHSMQNKQKVIFLAIFMFTLAISFSEHKALGIYGGNQHEVYQCQPLGQHYGSWAGRNRNFLVRVGKKRIKVFVIKNFHKKSNYVIMGAFKNSYTVPGKNSAGRGTLCQNRIRAWEGGGTLYRNGN